ncbi:MULTISPECIES: TonB-dependent receptor [unclassified Sphingomonas]|uniref:TonB-dependent receptor n=1 Tax=unclassified Sphingomonas TaxID=196159 RepID=UPI000A4667EB|nr:MULTISPECIES: TonB-dependent receptor [unclassified Sphingomonas]MBN8847485.1 TonB-dependent receptor [Sphingomonas sp.]
MRAIRKLSYGLSASASAFALLVAVPALALAQEGEGAQQAAPADSGLGDVVVTARRTEERAQKVPVAITAFTQDTIREKAISNGTDLQNFTPSLTVLGDVARNQETYTIRGMGGTESQGSGSGPGVVAYFAEVPTSASGPGNFFDLASLQVLKGPQGTLFGRNTTGGAVLLEPARPKMNTIEGYVRGTLGSLRRRSAEGALNVPIIDNVLAIRVAGQFDKRDGYVKDVVTGRDYLNRNNYSLRLGIQFNPTDTISSYTAVNYIDVDEHGGGSVLLAVRPGSPYADLLAPYLAAQQARGPYKTALSTPTFEKAKSLLILNNTQWQPTQTLTIKNIFSYARDRSTSATDRDSTPLPIADLLGAFPGSYNNNLRTITEELQVRYDDGTFRLQAGGFFLDQKSPQSEPLTFLTRNPLQALGILGGGPVVLPPALQAALGVDGPLLPALSVQPYASVWSRSKAAYAQAQYKITPTLTATAGFRWTWDSFGGNIMAYQDPASYQVFNQLAALGVITQDQAAQVIGLNANLCVYDAYKAVAAGGFPTLYYPNCTRPTFSGKSNGPTWQVGLDWQADPSTLVYAVSRRGYKSGANNPIVTLFLGDDYPLAIVKPERVTDAEVGLKRDWTIGGMKARTNIAAFYTWFNNIQVIQRAAIAGADILANAQKARVMGLEFEGVLQPFRALTLSGTYSYNDAKYLDYTTIAIPAIPSALTAAQPSMNLASTPFTFVARHKFSLDGRLALPIAAAAGDMALRATYSWQSRERVASDPQPFDTQAPYGLLNLRLEWNNVRGAPLDLAFYGTNVTGTKYRVTANTGYNNTGFSNSIYGEPAQYGFELRYRF